MIGLSVADRIATLTLNRPPVNAFNAAMFEAFAAALDALAARSDWSLLHIKSQLKVFSGGADLAEIAGAAMGGGFELALACDLRIAANEARLGLPETGLGLLPGGGGTQRLSWIAGPAVAARIILTADRVDGRAARELGMVQWAVPRAELAAEARKIAERVAGLSPLSLAASKVCMRLARDPERNGFAAETDWTARLLATEETRRRVADFLSGVGR